MPSVDNIYTINPKLHFPWGTPFKINDPENAARGNWWFREPAYGRIRGPFKNQSQAQLALDMERTGPLETA
jgi:hypothetical protein